MFLRFLLSLVDESEKIRQLANFLFNNILKGYKVFSRFAVVKLMYLFVIEI